MEQQIKCHNPQIMAIINITPDSFYGGSRTMESPSITARIEESIEQGASILDLGGYSSRPGATDVSVDQEFDRLSRAMSIVQQTAPTARISIDTFRSEIVRRLYDKFGSFTVNDICAGQADEMMIPLVGQLELPYIAMHIRGTPQTMQSMVQYNNITKEVLAYFEHKIEQCRTHGIKDLTLDPGFGFAKTVEQNFELLSHLNSLCSFGLPVLAGLSRKSMIWRTLDTTPTHALNGTTALNWEALRQGAAILRVHDVKEAAEVVKLFRTTFIPQ